jgi:hypothetical protein
VPSESTPSSLSPPWPYWRLLLAPSALGLLPRPLVPQVVLLLVDGFVIGLYVLGPGAPGDVQVLADVGLGFVFGVPATRSTWGCSAGTRGGAQPLLIRLSRVRPRGRCRRSRPESTPHRRGRASTWPGKDRSPTQHSPASQARIERSRPRSSSPAGPDSPHSRTEHEAPTEHTVPTEHTAHTGQEDTDVNQAHA